MKTAEELAAEGLEQEEAAWTDGLVLLCSKCSGQQHGSGPPATMPSWDTWTLRCWLKERMTAEGLWPRVRVLTSSCMGICRDGFVTCALGADAAGTGRPRCLVVDPARDAEELLALIRAAAGSGSGRS